MENTSDSFMPGSLLFCIKSKKSVCYSVADNIEGTDEKMQTVTEWQYDEKEMTVEEYENMALMKSVVEENTSGIVELVTQFQKDAVIDEYTQQLIEEGLI